MWLPERRYMGSMRARMTAGFVFILGPCLLVASAILPLFAGRVDELRGREQIGWIVERVDERLGDPDWRARLTELAAAKQARESHIALLVLNGDGALLWRSPGPGPAWPPEDGSNWRREVRPFTKPDKASLSEKEAIASKEDAPNPPKPSESGEKWEKVLGKTKILLGKRARAQAKSASQSPVWLGKRWDDWRLAAVYRVGPKDQPLVLVIFQSWWAVVHEQAVQKLGLLLLSLFAVFGMAGGAWLLVGRTLSPIRRLAVQASAASVENLQVRLKAPSRDAEVVDLVDTLNGLLARLAETAAVKGRFYAAASHELRTPLQALSGHLEVALSRGRSAVEYETFLQEASKQAGRLTSLVQDLLLLHQLDSAAPRAQEPVDLVEVCDSVVNQLAPLIDTRGLRLNAELDPGAVILAAPTHAEILVRNLVENAVKYASEGGEVTVRLASSGAGARLAVFNECPPVPGGYPERLFEPFYRPDSARTTRTGGNGLGLAICRGIAAANGWAVTLRQEPSGVRATATFGERGPAEPLSFPAKDQRIRAEGTRRMRQGRPAR